MIIFKTVLHVQVKGNHHTAVQIVGLDALARWIEAPQLSIWQQVAIAETLTVALSHQAKLASMVSQYSTLDGYHVGADWVIGLDYDEDSQAGQSALSHRNSLR